MNDHLNKTELTKQVTKAAIDFLHNAGFKPVETEVTLHKGWIADIAGVIVPTKTEAVNLKLIRKGKRFDASTNIEFSRLPEQIVGAVEVKTTKADYWQDRKFQRKDFNHILGPAAMLNWLAMPKGMLRSQEWPAQWGILEWDGNSLSVALPAPLMSALDSWRCRVITEIAMRRDNATRGNRMAAFNEYNRTANVERMTHIRFSKAIELAADLASGKYKTVDEAIEQLRLKCQLSKALKDKLEKLLPHRLNGNVEEHDVKTTIRTIHIPCDESPIKGMR